MYVKMFLCGVDGVRLAGANTDDCRLVGGVLALGGSLTVVECEDGGKAGSGERVGGVG